MFKMNFIVLFFLFFSSQSWGFFFAKPSRQTVINALTLFTENEVKMCNYGLNFMLGGVYKNTSSPQLIQKYKDIGEEKDIEQERRLVFLNKKNEYDDFEVYVYTNTADQDYLKIQTGFYVFTLTFKSSNGFVFKDGDTLLEFVPVEGKCSFESVDKNNYYNLDPENK